MPRIIDSEVRLICSTSEINLYKYIKAANIFVTTKLATLGLADEVLAEIEAWVTAHLICIAGKTNLKPTSGRGLHSTYYGKTAIMLDYSGTLESAGKKSASFVVYKPTMEAGDSPDEI